MLSFLGWHQLFASVLKRKIDEIGSRLTLFPHHHLKGSNRFRARVGDYRIIYTFDLEQNKIHLLAIGHRREIYRSLAAYDA